MVVGRHNEVISRTNLEWRVEGEDGCRTKLLSPLTYFYTRQHKVQ
jgi:hypothetical protein